MTAMSAAAKAGEGVLTAAIVARVADVAAAVARFVALEMVERFCAARGQRSSVATAGVVATVDVAVETVAAMEPGAGSKENPVDKPVWPIVAVRGAVIRGVIEVAVGAYGGRADVNANGDLAGRRGRSAHERNCENSGSKGFDLGHDFSLLALESKSRSEVAVEKAEKVRRCSSAGYECA